MVPDDDQAMVLPWASVMVIMVLLNEAFTCATPDAMFFRSRRRTRAVAVASLPIHDPFAADNPRAERCSTSGRRRRLLPARDGLGRSLAGAGVGVGALAADRQALAMTQPAIAAEIHQPLNVHRHCAPQIAFDLVAGLDRFTDLAGL